MLKDFLQEIEVLTAKARELQTPRPPAEPEHIYYLPDPANGWKRMAAEPCPRHHLAADLSAIVDFAERNPNAAVWYSRNGIICLLDDRTRRDRVTLPLGFSPQILTLYEMERKPILYGQKDLIFLLRTVFCNCIQLPTDLLQLVRQLHFKTAEQSAGKIQHGKESLGRSIEAELTGAADLPEYVTLDVPIFASTFAWTNSIRLALDVDLQSEKIRFIPLPRQIEEAIAGVEKRIGDELHGSIEGLEDGRGLFYGSPGE